MCLCVRALFLSNVTHLDVVDDHGAVGVERDVHGVAHVADGQRHRVQHLIARSSCAASTCGQRERKEWIKFARESEMKEQREERKVKTRAMAGVGVTSMSLLLRYP